jgi:hypothetical protein
VVVAFSVTLALAVDAMMVEEGFILHAYEARLDGDAEIETLLPLHTDTVAEVAVTIGAGFIVTVMGTVADEHPPAALFTTRLKS